MATDRELAILVSQLQDSLEAVDGLELDRAIAEHRELRRQSLGRGQGLGRVRSAFRVLDPRGEIRARRLRPNAASRREAATERRPAVRT